MFQPSGWDQGDVAEGRAAEIGHDGPIALLVQPPGLGGEILKRGIVDGSELFQIVLLTLRLSSSMGPCRSMVSK